MYNDYPYTDFHSLNLDYFLKKYREADLKVAGLRLSANGETNKIELLDSDGNVMNSITVPFATNATNATNAVNATNASSAVNASKDVNNKDLTSYAADATLNDNNLTLLDGSGNIIKTLSLTPQSVTGLITGYYKSGEKSIFDEDLDIDDEIIILTEYDDATPLTSFITGIKSGQSGSFLINDDTNTSLRCFLKPFALGNANTSPSVVFTAIYAKATPGGYTNLKWRLFTMTILSSPVDDKQAVKLTRID